MKLTRRQMVEGGLAAGLLGFAGPALAQVGVRRRPDGAILPPGFGQAIPQPHPGQPLPVRPQIAQPPAAIARPTVPAQPRVMLARSVDPRLVAAARASYDKHRNYVRHGDVVGIVDFSKVSSQPRYYLLDTNSGRITEHHVSHGRGSDPAHTGWLHQFSNRHGSNASSDGGYVTSETYHGKYGLSMRVKGLDWTNSNAEARAIVIHPAWYAEPTHIAQHGLLGRSEGCFAMSRSSMNETLARLGSGRFLFAGRVA
jgi:hypothetical protein